MTSGASRAARDGEPSRIPITEESEKTERHRKGGEDPEYLDIDDPDLDFKLDESIRKAWAELDAFEPDMEKLNAEMDRVMKEIDEGTLEEPDFSQRGPTHATHALHAGARWHDGPRDPRRLIDPPGDGRGISTVPRLRGCQ